MVIAQHTRPVWIERSFHACLSLPPSINRTGDVKTSNVQRKDGSVVRVRHTDSRARAWKDAALVELRRQGWRPVPEGCYHVTWTTHEYCAENRDEGAAEKIVRDVLAEAVGINDKRFLERHAYKHVVHHRKEYRLEVTVHVEEIPGGIPVRVVT